MVSVSVIDYIGKIKNGVAVLLSLNIDDNIFEMIFWFNKKMQYTLTVQDGLLHYLKLDNIYNYQYKDKLIDMIFKNLPPVKEIFKQFNI